jgi:hypothetical protein
MSVSMNPRPAGHAPLEALIAQAMHTGTLGMAKWVGEVHSADRLPDDVARAVHAALQGRPGPVVLALPEHMLRQATAAAVLPRAVPALGVRLGEMTSGGCTLRQVPRPAQKPVHVHAGAEELSRVYAADLTLQAWMPCAAWTRIGVQEKGLRVPIASQSSTLGDSGPSALAPTGQRASWCELLPHPKELPRAMRPRPVVVAESPCEAGCVALRCSAFGPCWSLFVRKVTSR